MKVAFLGLGVMGFPMAGHLKQAGHDVTVYNRNEKKAADWVKKYHGESAATPMVAVKGAEIVFICVGNDHDVRQVLLSKEGAFAGMQEGAILVDHTTASAELAREMENLAEERGLAFLDAPVSGGQVGAEQGKLTIMVGGKESTFLKAQSVMQIYAKACELMGPIGSGQLTKMVNQICIAGIVQGLAEGLNFGINAGLDTDKLLHVISKGAAQSWQMENRGKTMVEQKFDFGFAVDWMRKDLDICLAEAKRNGSRLPMTVLIDQFYAQIQERSGRRWDTSSLIHLLMVP